jgi:hypothetical protein
MKAVKKDGVALCFVPEEMRTAEVCLAAVKRVGRALADVPESLKTAEVCLAAVKRVGRALCFVPGGNADSGGTPRGAGR